MTALTELHTVAAQLPDADVEMLLADARSRLNRMPTPASEPPAWAGIIKDGPADLSSPERIDEMLADGFGRR
jgi:hypothetical protein